MNSRRPSIRCTRPAGRAVFSSNSRLLPASQSGELGRCAETMKLQDLHGGCGFIADGVSFLRLCSYIAQFPGVAFTRRRRFFWWASDIQAEFTLRGHSFKVWPDLEDSGIWVRPEDDEISHQEIQELREYVAQLDSRGVEIFQNIKKRFI